MGATATKKREWGSGTPASNKSVKMHNYQVLALTAHDIQFHRSKKDSAVANVASILSVSTSDASDVVIPTVSRINSLFQRSPKMDVIGGGSEGGDSSTKVDGTAAPIPQETILLEIERAGITIPSDVRSSPDKVSELMSSIYEYVDSDKTFNAQLALGCIYAGKPKKGTTPIYTSSTQSTSIDPVTGEVSVEGRGCTDPEADNYDNQAEYDDGTCQYEGDDTTDTVSGITTSVNEGGDQFETPAITTFEEPTNNLGKRQPLATGVLVNNVKELKDPEHKILFDQIHAIGRTVDEMAFNQADFQAAIATALPDFFQQVLDTTGNIQNTLVNPGGGFRGWYPDFTFWEYGYFKFPAYSWCGMSNNELEFRRSTESAATGGSIDWRREICDAAVPTGSSVKMIGDAVKNGCDTEKLYIGDVSQFFNKDINEGLLEEWKTGSDYLAEAIGLDTYFVEGGILENQCASVSGSEFVANITGNAKTFASTKMRAKATSIDTRMKSEMEAIFDSSGIDGTIYDYINKNKNVFISKSLMSSATPDSGSGPAGTGISSHGTLNPGGTELIEELKSIRKSDYKDIDDLLLYNYIFKWVSEIDEVDQLESSADAMESSSKEPTYMGPSGIQATELHKYSFSADWETIEEGRTEEEVLGIWEDIANSCG